jgi:hypothetical protein
MPGPAPDPCTVALGNPRPPCSAQPLLTYPQIIVMDNNVTTERPLSHLPSSGLYWVDINKMKHAGNCSGLRGDCSGLRGDCSGLLGDCSGLRGDCSGLRGNCTDLWGDCSDLWGDCSGIPTDSRPCHLSGWVQEQ